MQGLSSPDTRPAIATSIAGPLLLTKDCKPTMPQILSPNVLTTLAPGLVLNGLAWVHARAVTHYSLQERERPPMERLPRWERWRAILTGWPCSRPRNCRTPLDVGLSFMTHRIAIAEEKFLEVWLVPQADARGVAVLFPAYAESKDTLLQTAAILHRLGYTILMVDFRGAGGSSGTNTTLGWREAEDVAAAARYARQLYPDRPLVLFGMSMGAVAIARAIALYGVDATAAILECPFDRLISAVRHRLQVVGAPSFPLAELIVFWGSLEYGSNGFTHNPIEYARSVSCPTLVMRGDRDPRVTREEVAGFVGNLRGEKRSISVPGAGHELLADFNPELWQQEVEKFLSQNLPA